MCRGPIWCGSRLAPLLTGAADAAFGLSLEGQLAVFAAASALSCAAGYFVYRELHQRQHRHEEPLNERHRSMLGERGTVCEAFVNGRGKVRLGDSVWLASGPDLAEGATVVVSGFHGTRLVVEAMQPKPPAQPAAYVLVCRQGLVERKTTGKAARVALLRGPRCGKLFLSFQVNAPGAANRSRVFNRRCGPWPHAPAGRPAGRSRRQARAAGRPGTDRSAPVARFPAAYRQFP